ncbi:T9SS type A sorting domain-containing protein, partial [Campylobacter fetus subsp. venerealis]
TVYKNEGGLMSIGVDVPEDTRGRITVTDMFGKRLGDESRSFTKGLQAVEVRLEGTLPGFYVVTLYNYGSGEKVSSKFMIRLQ